MRLAQIKLILKKYVCENHVKKPGKIRKQQSAPFSFERMTLHKKLSFHFLGNCEFGHIY